MEGNDFKIFGRINIEKYERTKYGFRREMTGTRNKMFCSEQIKQKENKESKKQTADVMILYVAFDTRAHVRRHVFTRTRVCV